MAKILLLLILTFVSVSYAHDIWLENKGNKYILFYGHKYPHNDGSFSQKKIKYNPENIKSILCVRNNKVESIKFDKNYPISFNGNDCSLIYVIYSSGYWSKTPYGEVNKPKNQVNTVIKSWLSFEILKKVNKWDKSLEKPFINSLEIIPTNDISKLKKGEKIRLKILYNGKPIENVPVYYNGKFRGTTDEEGKINIKIRNKGLQLIEASYKEKINSNKADEVVYTTILEFETDK